MFKKFLTGDKSKKSGISTKCRRDTLHSPSDIALTEDRATIRGTPTHQFQPPAEEDTRSEYADEFSNPNHPFGDGNDKIFGMENFGNTCYCNSILQCLYYTSDFKEKMLAYPHKNPKLTSRKRKSKILGSKTHSFIAYLNNQTQSAQNANAASQTSSSDNGSSSSKTKSSSRRTSIFGLKRESTVVDDQSSQIQLQESQHSGNSSNSTDVFHQENNGLLVKYPNFKNIKFIPDIVNQQNNITVVGAVSDISANSDQRKKQALVNGPIIHLDQSFHEEYGLRLSLFTVMKDLFECMAENTSSYGVVSPVKLIEILKKENELFRSSMHQDAHEFLNFVINSITETEEGSTFQGIFEGLLTSETKCLACETISSRDEKFLDLSIDLTKDSSITNCLKNFSQMEMLNGSNKFYCDTCHSLQEAARTVNLKKLPKVLALHLKRFKYEEALQRNVKLFHRIAYTKTLRVFNTTEDSVELDKLYELYAVIVHIGGGPYHGHYVSLIKTPFFGWLLFDDETVEAINEDYVLRFFGDGVGLATAYVLFYQELQEKSYINFSLYGDHPNEAVHGG
ncbi:Ubiquitin carboxyl-terminal hydrolase 13 [Komagataella phaffii CBS 7435]|uniref:Ubiquitin carboxyl-terminal hydrolase n=2 Tax=Komagataella phaffii TaxID=460519 RepID=C4QX39_KOMPG|nr:uncharacterized protein PAS_chr1-1_0435 [Komagataella phaffii GS115]AOA61543.1 GQ67_02211T0 [Komagataella phaffii]CAH2446611.1 Ubiquitin carboxyl-terminal hydrolase 13 [Komagataella phaffii CBS 7435]AOA65909.1 GQ68_02225T0 [Komagataella phaffii GS115]CAY67812.1 Putative ubiquitin carboxyl-terminal hydrolase, ubiquitin-specific proteas [Komagataella phaffii GS115]CCA36895.1 Ubiquitin carboxyl-terminal hydrolase 13 [Komagataella phaffii CBS 7435]